MQTSDLYLLSASDWMNYFGTSEQTAHKLVAGLADIALLEKELDLIEEHKIKLITIADVAYPSLLKEIHSPPIVLYFQGNSKIFSQKCLAVVGARKANDYGKRAVDLLVPDLVAAGYSIVSGGALGIDTMAHEAALKCGGKTIAILGSGLLRLYPSSNKKLFASIIENGGIVASSYPLKMEGLPQNFPARNRIVTGLSQGCVVVQAAKKSGALISAHCALEQGREVFAVPGNFDDELSAGCHEIIQQGAKLVMSSADILSEFGEKLPAARTTEEKSLQQAILFGSASSSTSRARPEPVEGYPRALEETLQLVQGERKKELMEIYSESQQKIILACKKPISLEDLITMTDLSFEQVQSELFTLQLEGVISQDFSGHWGIL